MKAKAKGRIDTYEVTLANLGIAAERALHYWRRLPVSVQSFYEADDMIAEVVLHVFKKADKYNPKRAKASTFVHHVATTCCLDIVARYRAVKRGAAVTVPLEENWRQAESEVAQRYADADRHDENESREAIERLLQYAPMPLWDTLERLLTRQLKGIPSPDVMSLLRDAVKKNGITRRDFDTVLRCFAQ